LPDSQHLVGTAVDICTRDTAGLASRLAQRGLRAVNEGSHVHVQVFPAGALRQSGVLARLGL